MKGNKLIYIGIIMAIVFFSSIYFSTSDNPGEGKVEQHSPILKPLVVDTLVGDSTADSYDSLQATVHKGIKKNELTQEEVGALINKLSLLEKKFEQFKSETEYKNKQREVGGSIATLPVKDFKGEPEKLVEKVKLYTPKSTNEVPKDDFQLNNDFSLSEGLGFSKINKGAKSRSSRVYSKDDPNGGWLMPLESEVSFKDVLGTSIGKVKKTNPSNFPAMTISDNSIIYDTTALTYLVGRIPVSGRVPDPFPVKMIAGRDVLIANGHNLPGIDGMFFSGYATGDMNLSCVRAEMNSYTFVFEDGRQVTYRTDPAEGGGKQEPMAYISDRHGLPCVMGEFVSTVGEFLSIQASLTGLAAAGESFSAAQVTTGVNSLGGSSSTVTGDAGKYALGKVVSSAFSDVSKWMLERQGNSFDAVVVPSGAKVSLHINRDIMLDYNEASRRVDYRKLAHKRDLD